MNVITVTMGNDGEVTLPLEVWKELGVAPGDEIEFIQEEGQVRITPFHREESKTPGIE